MAKLLQPQERSSSSNQYPYKIATPLSQGLRMTSKLHEGTAVSFVVVAKKHLHH
ncbi:hypothetical protein [Lysinibacillus capsici]|uniref:hypothetical protein n=1 Tax=Lysinibacillus capsici TaxID=2115968 RepID=UPI002152E15E|nr:hypothetical protein [Lysinibacillus capsici]MCR6522285.1 hypothetical protein [Lysinibacillus capsici]